MENQAHNEAVMNSCKVIDKGNGLSSFVPYDGQCNAEPLAIDRPNGFFAKILRWLKTSTVTPYIKLRDLADPFRERHDDLNDIDVGSDGKNAVEVGIKVKF